jgi:predicted amidohydrolase
LVEQGVDLILCPSLTWNRRGMHRVRYGAHARAMENQLYVVGSPLISSSGLPADAPLHGTGRAFVTAPIDRTLGVNDGLLAVCAAESEDVLVVDLDPALLAASRVKPEVPGLRLRRSDLYEALRVRGKAATP